MATRSGKMYAPPVTGSRYEGSKEDTAEDMRGARKLGVGLRKYERTARDRAEDKRGQARLMLKKKGS